MNITNPYSQGTVSNQMQYSFEHSQIQQGKNYDTSNSWAWIRNQYRFLRDSWRPPCRTLWNRFSKRWALRTTMPSFSTSGTCCYNWCLIWWQYPWSWRWSRIWAPSTGDSLMGSITSSGWRSSITSTRWWTTTKTAWWASTSVCIRRWQRRRAPCIWASQWRATTPSKRAPSWTTKVMSFSQFNKYQIEQSKRVKSSSQKMQSKNIHYTHLGTISTFGSRPWFSNLQKQEYELLSET